MRYRPQASRARRDTIVAARGGRVLRRMDRVNVDHVLLPPGLEVAASKAGWNDPDVLSIEPNYVRQVVAAPNDPYWVNGSLWGLKKIQADRGLAAQHRECGRRRREFRYRRQLRAPGSCREHVAQPGRDCGQRPRR